MLACALERLIFQRKARGRTIGASGPQADLSPRPCSSACVLRDLLEKGWTFKPVCFLLHISILVNTLSLSLASWSVPNLDSPSVVSPSMAPAPEVSSSVRLTDALGLKGQFF